MSFLYWKKKVYSVCLLGIEKRKLNISYYFVLEKRKLAMCVLFVLDKSKLSMYIYIEL